MFHQPILSGSRLVNAIRFGGFGTCCREMSFSMYSGTIDRTRFRLIVAVHRQNFQKNLLRDKTINCMMNHPLPQIIVSVHPVKPWLIQQCFINIILLEFADLKGESPLHPRIMDIVARQYEECPLELLVQDVYYSALYQMRNCSEYQGSCTTMFTPDYVLLCLGINVVHPFPSTMFKYSPSWRGKQP